MPARFYFNYFTSRNSVLDQQTAFANVDASQHRTLRSVIYGATQPPRYINLTQYPNNDASFAVLMAGQTPELQAALNQDMADRIEGFWSTNDEILVWFIRRQTGGPLARHTETVALIMPCLTFLRPRIVAGNYSADPAQNGSPGWAFRFRTIRDGTPGYQGLTLLYLRDTLLGGLHGTQAWL